jgi:hypothetical protein
LFGAPDDFALAREMCEEFPELWNPDRPLFQTGGAAYQNTGVFKSKKPPAA